MLLAIGMLVDKISQYKDVQAQMEPFLQTLDRTVDNQPQRELVTQMRTYWGATASDVSVEVLRRFREQSKAFIRSQWQCRTGVARYRAISAIRGATEGGLYCDIEVGEVHKVRGQLPYLTQRRTDMYDLRPLEKVEEEAKDEQKVDD